MDSVKKWWGNCPIKYLLLILFILYAWSTCSKDKEVMSVTTDKNCTPEKNKVEQHITQSTPTKQYNRYGHYAPQYRPLPEDISTRYRTFSSPYQSYNYYDRQQNTTNQQQLPYNQPKNTWQPPNYSPYTEQLNTTVPPYYAPNQYNQ